MRMVKKEDERLKKYVSIIILICSLVLTACGSKVSLTTPSSSQPTETQVNTGFTDNIELPDNTEPPEENQRAEPSKPIQEPERQEVTEESPLLEESSQELTIQEPKEQPKEQPKEVFKEVPQEVIAEIPKQTPIEEPKETPKAETAAVTEFWKEVEDQIITLCNEERIKAGVAPLESNETLREIARYKSKEMLENNYFAHKSAVDGAMPWELADRFGYSYSTFGENIWMSQMDTEDPMWTEEFKSGVTARNIVNDWMNSPGHRANILDPKYKKIGVGLIYSSKLKAYATQSFSD